MRIVRRSARAGADRRAGIGAANAKQSAGAPQTRHFDGIHARPDGGAFARGGIDEARAIIGGLPPDSAFASAFLQNRPLLDIDRARAEIADAARAVCKHNNIGALLLECANMPPFAAAAGVPVRSVIDAIAEFRRDLAQNS